MQNLRLALVTDLHVGSALATKTGPRVSEALTLTKAVIEEANASSADLLVSLGDNINATSAEEDYKYLTILRDVFATSRIPVVPCFGNNDLKFLTHKAVAEALGCSAASERRILKGWNLLFWRPACEMSLNHGGPVFGDEDLSWLDKTLEQSTYPIIIFLHAPIDDHSTTGNAYTEARPDLASYRNGGAARELIQNSGKVVLVLAGHVHWNAGSTIDGVHYRTLAALSDTFRINEEPSGTWALLDLTANRMTLDVRGNEPMLWSVPPRKKHEHWRRPFTKEAYEERLRGRFANSQANDHKSGC